MCGTVATWSNFSNCLYAPSLWARLWAFLYDKPLSFFFGGGFAIVVLLFLYRFWLAEPSHRRIPWMGGRNKPDFVKRFLRDYRVWFILLFLVATCLVNNYIVFYSSFPNLLNELGTGIKIWTLSPAGVTFLENYGELLSLSLLGWLAACIFTAILIWFDPYGYRRVLLKPTKVGPRELHYRDEPWRRNQTREIRHSTICFSMDANSNITVGDNSDDDQVNLTLLEAKGHFSKPMLGGLAKSGNEYFIFLPYSSTLPGDVRPVNVKRGDKFHVWDETILFWFR